MSKRKKIDPKVIEGKFYWMNGIGFFIKSDDDGVVFMLDTGQIRSSKYETENIKQSCLRNDLILIDDFERHSRNIVKDYTDKK